MGHYTTMSTQDIAELRVAAIAAEDSILLLWATWYHLEDALLVIKQWGFDYRTTVPWIKMSRDGLLQNGMGRHVRHCSEPLLIARRGKNRVVPLTTAMDGVLFSSKGRHSAKPDKQYVLAEQYPGPYLEIFARPNGGLVPIRGDHWTHIGDEITGRDVSDDLDRLAAEVSPNKPWVRPASKAAILEEETLFGALG